MFRFLHKLLADQPRTTYTEKEDVIRMKTQTKAPSCFSMLEEILVVIISKHSQSCLPEIGVYQSMNLDPKRVGI